MSLGDNIQAYAHTENYVAVSPACKFSTRRSRDGWLDTGICANLGDRVLVECSLPDQSAVRFHCLWLHGGNCVHKSIDLKLEFPGSS